MIRMINKLTKTDMWVHESKLDKYKAAGHKPAASAPVAEAKQEAPAEKPDKNKKK